ncbi:MAG: carbohydrate ABC transporter permease [Lachnospirales bacterium]
MKKNSLFKPTTADYVIGILLLILAIIILFPFYNAVIISLVTETEYVRTPFMIFPKNIDLSSYKLIFTESNILSGMKITIFITVIGTFYNMFLTTLCAYALTKDFFGRRVVSLLIIFTVYFSGGLIPFYLMMKDLNLIDSILAMILPSGISFMYMIVIRRNFEEIPKSLMEAAEIDGANDLVTLFKIILPITKPILVTFALYYAVDRWNEWWHGMLFIKSVEKQPLQLILRNLVQDASATSNGTSAGVIIFGDGIKMAATVVSMVPIMLVYPFLQKYFIGGMTTGAVKE